MRYKMKNAILVGGGPCRFKGKRTLPVRLGLVVLAILLICGCGLNLTTPVDSGTSQDFDGKILWRDLLTRDASQAKAFYGELFGWTYRSQGRFNAILQNGREIGGIVEIAASQDAGAAARWIPSLSVRNLKQAMAFTKQNGGQINEGPMVLGKRGNGALVRDDGGAQFVLLQSSGQDARERTFQINDWLWDELWSDNPRQSLDYYGSLAGFSGSEEKDGYWILTSNGKWQAGVRKVFNEQFVQRWVPVVRVADPIETAQKALTLGGRILIEASDSGEEFRSALIADPGGALFIVQEWSDNSAEKGE